MRDQDIDRHLQDYLSGDPAQDAFKQQVLEESTAEFVRARRRCRVWFRAAAAVAAVLIVCLSFLAGRVSAPANLPHRDHVQVDSQSSDVTVPRDLIVWLDAARLFGRLGMEDRMARAVERAGKLLPKDLGDANDPTEGVFATTQSEGRPDNPEPSTDRLGTRLSTERQRQILALTFGD